MTSKPIDLRALRLAAGLRQTELAEFLNVDHTSICKYETGGRAIPNEKLAAWLRVCGLLVKHRTSAAA